MRLNLTMIQTQTCFLLGKLVRLTNASVAHSPWANHSVNSFGSCPAPTRDSDNRTWRCRMGATLSYYTNAQDGGSVCSGRHSEQRVIQTSVLKCSLCFSTVLWLISCHCLEWSQTLNKYTPFVLFKDKQWRLLCFSSSDVLLCNDQDSQRWKNFSFFIIEDPLLVDPPGHCFSALANEQNCWW